MGLKHHTHKAISYPHLFSIRSSTILTLILFLACTIYLFAPARRYPDHLSWPGGPGLFRGDLRDARFPWNKLCYGPAQEKLKLAVFSRTWPAGPSPGGMERHAYTLYSALAARGHEIHVFTVPSDKKPHEEMIIRRVNNVRLHFAPNDHGMLNCSHAFEIFGRESRAGAFDYVHTESVSLPHWRARKLPNVAVTWHGIWYEIMHSKLFQELFWNPKGQLPGLMAELHEAMPRLIDEIKFFRRYTQHICISNSAGEVLTNIYQLPIRNVHVILNGVDNKKFIQDPESGTKLRLRYGIPNNASLVMGIAGRLVLDKGHPLLREAFTEISKRHPDVFLLVAGSGPWGKRYAELGPTVKILGPLEANELSDFYNAVDVFVNPTFRPQGLDLTLIEAMHCGTPVLTPNFPSITGTVVLNEGFGYTFSPNVKSLVEAMETAIRDGVEVLERKGEVCKEYVGSMFTAEKMASAYERFFLCMKNDKYCQYPLPTDC